MENQEELITEGMAFLQSEKGTELTGRLVGQMDDLRKEMEPSMDPPTFYKLIGQLVANTTFTVDKSGEELSDSELEDVAGGVGVDHFGFRGFKRRVTYGGFSRLGTRNIGLKIRLSEIDV